VNLLQPLLDEDWAVAITAQIDALPEVLADVLAPYDVGCIDAQKGEACEPLTHYARLGDIEMYLIGYHDATTTIEAALDYEEDQLDREYHARGMY
jgi:hypothetical protein